MVTFAKHVNENKEEFVFMIEGSPEVFAPDAEPSTLDAFLEQSGASGAVRSRAKGRRFDSIGDVESFVFDEVLPPGLERRDEVTDGD